jgi:hypothetical protein
MIGHSFGLVAAVYNYNRRSALVNEILQKVFKLVSFNFYDDKYGFETEHTIDSAMECAQLAHTWLGAKFDESKLQLGAVVDILGVTYDLDRLLLLIKESRKEDLVAEISGILEAGLLEPGHAGKLKGKLMFAASQLWGKVGRAFLLAISERQYSKTLSRDQKALLGTALEQALKQWTRLVKEGPPRELKPVAPAKSDVVIFTDGFFPDPRRSEKGPARVGAVMFDRRRVHPVQFSEIVPKEVMDKWISRVTQIFMIELVAIILALETFRYYLHNTNVLLLVDAEAVEGALVKGYSSRSDVSLLVGKFWELAQELGAAIYVDRVPTDANCSDGPSRDKVYIGRRLGWLEVEARWPSEVHENGRAWGIGSSASSCNALGV